MIVEVNESVLGEGAFEVVCPGKDVCPFPKQDPVEAFDLAARLWPAQADLLHGRSRLGARAEPESGAIAGSVVRRQSLAVDAMRA